MPPFMDAARVARGRVFRILSKEAKALLLDPPHLVITDSSTSVELAATLRDMLGPRCPRVLLASGAPVKRSDLVHFDGHFQKPFRVKDLVATILRLFAGAAPTLPPPRP